MRRFQLSDFFSDQLSIAICVLVVSGSVFAGPGESPAAGEITFNDVFLRQVVGQQIDISRFNQGNAALVGSYRTDLYVNQVWVGRTEMALGAINNDARDVQPCFDSALLERMGVDLIKLQPETAAQLQKNMGKCTPLSVLIEGAIASFDNSEQRLDASIPQVFMARQSRDYVDPQYWDEGITAGRLRYNANVYQSQNLGDTSTNGYLGLAAGLNLGAWRFNHQGSTTYDQNQGTHYESLQSNLQRSIGPLKSQLVIGDSFTDGAMFDSFGIRGVQLSSDDRMYPESLRGYAPTVRGIAQTNARVQVRQNGAVIYETTVSPGPFEITDLYPTGYGGDLEVAVTEANGAMRVSRVPYAAAVNALRPGVTRYSVVGGQYRNPNIENAPSLLQGTVQHGFTNLLTGYGGSILSQNYNAAVVGAALNTPYGAFSTDITHATTQLSNETSRKGDSVRVSYSKLLESTNTNLAVAAYRYSSEGYLSFADAALLQDFDRTSQGADLAGIQRGKLQATINQALAPGWGNFYLSGSTQNYWNRSGRDTQIQAGYNNSYKRTNYGVALSRQLNVTTSTWDNQVLFTVAFPLGDGPRVPYSSTQLQRDSSGATNLQESLTGTLGKDNQLAYGINAGRSGGGDASPGTSLGGNVSYISPFTTMSASASQNSNYTQMSAGLSGGVVAYDGGVVLTPSMGDTLAVVDAKDAAGARVANGSGLKVDPWGHAVVSNLTPFARNQVEIDPQGLPLNVELKSTMQQVAPTAGAVVKMKFETERAGRTAIIEIRRADGKLLPFGVEVRDAGGQIVGTIAQGGRILARGLKASSGTLTAALTSENGQQCQFPYQLPEEENSRSTNIIVSKVACIE
ncbi:fimbria/pilus outer membrane usher protein [Pseudomonas fluorescens]|uniref:Outer membrane usher protein HtrE n=1 Tax=Pseudomonas fluorescens TaxID=294 RepID=A0A5E7PQW8_PSEFL|nr:fimbria/pilus outer membrane usher protein [Pseudomonas fluorescens]VVP51994.1 Outer membrane usher protein HtrE [Pseudomonas fluorescens]